MTVTPFPTPRSDPRPARPAALLPPQTVDVDTVIAVAAGMGVDRTTALAAARHIADGTAVLLAFSGKIASGKDSVAPAVFDALGVRARRHEYYANPLKDELDAIIADLRGYADRRGEHAVTPRYRSALAGELSEAHRFSRAHGLFFAGPLFDQVRINRAVHARTRTAVIRRALQYLGTEVRRAQDPDYWVHRALAPVLHALAQGTSVYFTDARFVNEVVTAERLGARSVRLDISADTQRARLAARDSLPVDPETLVHVSELALDDFPDFTLRVRNERTLDEAVTAIVAGLSAPLARAA